MLIYPRMKPNVSKSIYRFKEIKPNKRTKLLIITFNPLF